MLVLVVGPSGAGKDSLLKAAKTALQGDPRIRFARRVITRPADPMGEDHEPVTEAEFSARAFALSWSAHGLRYGIETMDTAPILIANVSRGVIAEAASRYKVAVIEVTAPPDILAARLAARQRETPDDITRRLRRSATIPPSVRVETVSNDGTLEAGVALFIATLRLLISEGSLRPG